ncbi:MAG: RNA polymerase sigma-70 factor [Saprospiraceae bacterium]|nr:RNA polymerase sigma-70 factor [Saprospiraceae bacterium]
MQHKITDQELLHLFKTDGDQAMKLLFGNYYGFICNVIFKVLPDKVLVEDIAQEVFYEVWRRKDRLKISTTISAYLKRAAINRTLNYIRDQKIKFDEEEKIDLAYSSAPKAQQQVEAKEMEQMINAAIDSLPERCRIVFALSRFEEMSYQEIADKLNISIKTVENQISKALKVLRIKLKNHL